MKVPAQRKLGNSGIEVPPLCLGGNVFGWTADERTSFKLLDGLLAADFNFIDTADVYSRWAPGHHGGESETILGKWMKQRGNRQRVILATKCGMEMSPDNKGLARAYILRAAEDSLRRLQTDTIDLYQAHQDDPSTPLEETLGAFAQLIQQGKVRAIGASNYTASRLAEALRISEENGLPRYECLQPWYNLADRHKFEGELEALCLREKLGVITYYSLARGFLSGKYRSQNALGQSPRGKGVAGYLNERGMKILSALDEIAREYYSTPARVALAWLMARPSVTAAIASATSLDQLTDLIESTRLDLSPAALALLDQASAVEAEPTAAA